MIAATGADAFIGAEISAVVDGVMGDSAGGASVDGFVAGAVAVTLTGATGSSITTSVLSSTAVDALAAGAAGVLGCTSAGMSDEVTGASLTEGTPIIMIMFFTISEIYSYHGLTLKWRLGQNWIYYVRA